MATAYKRQQRAEPPSPASDDDARSSAQRSHVARDEREDHSRVIGISTPMHINIKKHRKAADR